MKNIVVQEKTMLSDLPKELQQQVLYYLETNNFTTAKKIHDDWLNGLQPKAPISNQGNQDYKNLIYVSLLACTLKSLSHRLHPLMPIFFKVSNFTEISGAGQ